MMLASTQETLLIKKVNSILIQIKKINMGFMNLYIGLEFVYVMEGILLVQ